MPPSLPSSPTMDSDDSNSLTSTNGTSQNGLLDEKPIILHLGGPILYNKKFYEDLRNRYTVIHLNQEADLHRLAFMQHLRAGTWGNFSAIFRPFWATGKGMHPWDDKLIELLPPKMKVMASAGAGFDWVDEKCLAEHGILYCNGAGASAESVADMALFFIIAVFRNMMWSIGAARSGSTKEWESAHNDIPAQSHNPRGHVPSQGHTLGIVGFGNIGQAIAKKAKLALGMRIIYRDVCRKPADQEQEVDATYYESLEELLNNSDCVLIATPHMNRPILDASTLYMLPKGARVVNIARGSLINEDDLADALEKGHISEAALDVHTGEPEVNERLRKMRNVMLTSHTGGGTVETIREFEHLAMQNVDLVLQGKDPLTPVNKHLINSAAHTNGTG